MASVSAEDVMLTVELAHVPSPRVVAPEKSVTVFVPSQLIVKVGVVSLVMLSAEEVPVSEALSRSGVLGASGTPVSIVNIVTLSADDALPALSVTVTVQLPCDPSASVVKVTVLLPDVAEVVRELQAPP